MLCPRMHAPETPWPGASTAGARCGASAGRTSRRLPERTNKQSPSFRRCAGCPTAPRCFTMRGKSLLPPPTPRCSKVSRPTGVGQRCGEGRRRRRLSLLGWSSGGVLRVGVGDRALTGRQRPGGMGGGMLPRRLQPCVLDDHAVLPFPHPRQTGPRRPWTAGWPSRCPWSCTACTPRTPSTAGCPGRSWWRRWCRWRRKASRRTPTSSQRWPTSIARYRCWAGGGREGPRWRGWTRARGRVSGEVSSTPLRKGGGQARPRFDCQTPVSHAHGNPTPALPGRVPGVPGVQRHFLRPRQKGLAHAARERDVLRPACAGGLAASGCGRLPGRGEGGEMGDGDRSIGAGLGWWFGFAYRLGGGT